MAHNARDADMKWRLQEMHQRIEALQNKVLTSDEGITARIMQESIFVNFKISHLESYNGLGD